MTVKQLQKALSKMPQDAEVIYYDGDNGETSVNEVEYRNYTYTNMWKLNPTKVPANIVVLGE